VRVGTAARSGAAARLRREHRGQRRLRHRAPPPGESRRTDVPARRLEGSAPGACSGASGRRLGRASEIPPQSLGLKPKIAHTGRAPGDAKSRRTAATICYLAALHAWHQLRRDMNDTKAKE
jgi:hypothetical protein